MIARLRAPAAALTPSELARWAWRSLTSMRTALPDGPQRGAPWAFAARLRYRTGPGCPPRRTVARSTSRACHGA